MRGKNNNATKMTVVTACERGGENIKTIKEQVREGRNWRLTLHLRSVTGKQKTGSEIHRRESFIGKK